MLCFKFSNSRLVNYQVTVSIKTDLMGLRFQWNPTKVPYLTENNGRGLETVLSESCE
jgi:hypothetical protein